VIDLQVGVEVLQQHEPLELRILYSGPGRELAALNIELLRAGETAGQRPQWRAGQISVRDEFE
jgi:hypothetical protein